MSIAEHLRTAYIASCSACDKQTMLLESKRISGLSLTVLGWRVINNRLLCPECSQKESADVT